MEIVCTSCKKPVGSVTALARLILTVHCPFCGQDFGAGIDPPESVADAPGATPAPAPAA
jgi:hypothetical protein